MFDKKMFTLCYKEAEKLFYMHEFSRNLNMVDGFSPDIHECKNISDILWQVLVQYDQIGVRFNVPGWFQENVEGFFVKWRDYIEFENKEDEKIYVEF